MGVWTQVWVNLRSGVAWSLVTAALIVMDNRDVRKRRLCASLKAYFDSEREAAQ